MKWNSILCSILMTAVVAFSAVDENGANRIPLLSAENGVTNEDLLNPHHPAWANASSQPLHFHRTPPLYADGPFDDGERPKAYVTFIKGTEGMTFIRVEWTDANRDVFLDGKRYPDGGAEHIYKEHTEVTDQFGDAVCLMVPASGGASTSYPSMMMGDQPNPVKLFFWQSGRGFSLLQAHGRATTEPTQTELTGKSLRTETGWVVIFQLTNLPAATPVCFAIWDGAKQHRDGMKYYSLWYEVQS